MLALAQKLHDEHVEAGKAERNKIVNEAQEHAGRLVREAEEKQRETLGDLEEQRQVLQRKVEQLRAFEREYRSRLKAYLEDQLKQLEAKAAAGGSEPDAGQRPAARTPAGRGHAAADPRRRLRLGDDGERQGQCRDAAVPVRELIAAARISARAGSSAPGPPGALRWSWRVRARRVGLRSSTAPPILPAPR